LVYFEHVNDIEAAIAREKQLKSWKRKWKDELVWNQNPDWVDLSLAG
jgi:putative endonuclease